MVKSVSVVGAAQAEVLDKALRNALGAKVFGVSTGGGKLYAHLTDESAIVDEQKAQTVLENYGALTVRCNKQQIVANGSDTATITYSTGAANVDWIAYLGSEIYASGNEAAVGGVVTLTLATELAGTYRVYIIEITGDFGTGHVQIEAV